MSLKHRAFITGASSGIGQSMVAAYLAAGYAVEGIDCSSSVSPMNLNTFTTSWISPIQCV